MDPDATPLPAPSVRTGADRPPTQDAQAARTALPGSNADTAAQAAPSSDHPTDAPSAAGRPWHAAAALTSQGYPGRLAFGVMVLSLLLAVAALWLAVRTEERARSLEQELVRRQQGSQDQAAEARTVAQQAQEASREAAAKVALLDARVAEAALQRSQLEELIQSLSRSRDENLVADIDAALRVALQQTAITGSAEPMVAALRAADERLARVSQPRLEGVRRAIARDLERTRAAGVADVPTLAIRLDEVVRLVDELPLINQVPAAPAARKAAAVPAAASAPAARGARSAAVAASAAAASAAAPSPVEPFGPVRAGWQRLGDHVWEQARGLLRVTRIDQPEAMLLAPEQAWFLRENFKLRLLNARLALLSRQFDTAYSDLTQANASLGRYFDANARKTQVVSELLRQVTAQSRQSGVPRPDDTLAALSAVAAGQ